MKERPISFSGPMVRAILEGRKTQTRRIVKFPHMNPLGAWEPTTVGGPSLYLDKACTIKANAPKRVAMWHTRTGDVICCPYGVPGDRMWVREAFAGTGGHENEKVYYYAADDVQSPHGKWVSPRFMPRIASRLTLEVTGVRVERLNEISAKDIIAEGAVLRAHEDQFGRNPVSAFDGMVYMDLKSLYAAGWNSLHGKGSWSANPWVWVIEFQRLPGERA